MENIVLPPQKNWLYKLGKHPRLKPYNRVFILIMAVNLIVFTFSVTTWNWFSKDGIALNDISNAILFNFALAILIRQQYVVNLLFKIATSAPKNWPLSIRRICAKIYHFGGLHSGGATMGTLWYFIFVGSLYYHYSNGLSGVNTFIISLTSGVLLLLVFIIIMALPTIRAKYHNSFEVTHRIGGWSALLLFWVQMIAFIKVQNQGVDFDYIALFSSLNFWILIALTISAILPWLRLKKVDVHISKPSNHVALAAFDYGVTPFAGSSTVISRNPLFEWHAFANVPSPDKEGFRLTISRAGDWTGKFISETPNKVWVKGIPTAGVGNVDKLFNKVVWVATGSGIGPCIPHLLLNKTPSLLIWATRTPEKTYGKELIEEIKEVQPNAIIWNTDTHGKPDLVKLAYKAYKDFGAEAVICISNQSLTNKVVYGMESRGIPAYGAIWDS
ncbi:hypothetical protein LVK03_13805 [Tenacibaculum maritimum]|uniref:hypothetical protein n=2 Tax=Tenacibaculum maritimum TaxID=107401 RepID=UPI001E30E627|nr:hypothetical protein [Tenacibaculum maritimum]MCD9586145.1 hypothetical protein [Tenacibaculum maritimum]MCD9628505.1 hypothetical protein [Tenacibaculum maritimum]